MDASSSPSGFLPQQRVVSMQFRNWKARGMSQRQGPLKACVANWCGWQDLPITPSRSAPHSLHSQVKSGSLEGICYTYVTPRDARD